MLLETFIALQQARIRTGIDASITREAGRQPADRTKATPDALAGYPVTINPAYTDRVKMGYLRLRILYV